MLPELLKIPKLGVTIYSYGVMLTIGFAGALWLTARLAESYGISKGRILELVAYLLPLALLGTRVLMIGANWKGSVHDSRGVLALDLLHSVGFYFGGFLTALAFSVVIMRLMHMQWSRTADACAPGLALGNVMGRLGCFAAGCCWGKQTRSWIGVKFTVKAHETNGVPMDVALIPTQLIEAGANLVVLALLLWLWKRRSFNGQIILAYVILYSAERFLVEFWRDDPRGKVMDLSISQFIAACMLPLALVFYVRLHKLMQRKSSTMIDTQGVDI